MPITAAVLDVDGTIATCPYDFDAMRAAVARIAARRDIDTASLGVRGIIEQIALVADRLGDAGQTFRQEADAAVKAIEVTAARGASLLPGAAEAIAALGRVADRTVVVDDHDYDMQAGRAAGVRLSVAVRTGNRPDEALRTAGADHIIDTLADLPAWLRARGEMPT